MTGTLAGFNFKFVVNSMLATKLLFPEYKERVDAMKDDGWYPWDEFTEMVTAIAERMGETVTKNVGMKIIQQAKEVFISQGFKSADSILHDYFQLFEANVKDAPELDPPRTISYEPGKTIIRAGTVQPRMLIEGYLTGIVRMYGHTLRKIDYSEVEEEGVKLHKFEMEWTNPDTSFA